MAFGFLLTFLSIDVLTRELQESIPSWNIFSAGVLKHKVITNQRRAFKSWELGTNIQICKYEFNHCYCTYWYCVIVRLWPWILEWDRRSLALSAAHRNITHCQSNEMNNTECTQCCVLATLAHTHLHQHSSNISLDIHLLSKVQSLKTCGSISTFFSILCPPWDHSVFQIRHAVSKAEIFKFHDNGWRGRKNQNCGHGRQQG